MATIISTLFISLDGVAEIDPAWHFPYFDQSMGEAVNEDFAGTDLLLPRRALRTEPGRPFAAYWAGGGLSVGGCDGGWVIVGCSAGWAGAPNEPGACPAWDWS